MRERRGPGRTEDGEGKGRGLLRLRKDVTVHDCGGTSPPDKTARVDGPAGEVEGRRAANQEGARVVDQGIEEWRKSRKEEKEPEDGEGEMHGSVGLDMEVRGMVGESLEGADLHGSCGLDVLADGQAVMLRNVPGSGEEGLLGCPGKGSDIEGVENGMAGVEDSARGKDQETGEAEKWGGKLLGSRDEGMLECPRGILEVKGLLKVLEGGAESARIVEVGAGVAGDVSPSCLPVLAQRLSSMECGTTTSEGFEGEEEAEDGEGDGSTEKAEEDSLDCSGGFRTAGGVERPARQAKLMSPRILPFLTSRLSSAMSISECEEEEGPEGPRPKVKLEWKRRPFSHLSSGISGLSSVDMSEAETEAEAAD